MIDAAPVYSVLASPSSLTLELRIMFFELCFHDGQAPIRRAMLSGDSFCCLYNKEWHWPGVFVPH